MATRTPTTGPTLDELMDLVRDRLHEVYVLNGRELPQEVELTGETALFGRGALLDSLGLVSLVLELELAVSERYGADVVLSDEKAMSQRNSPFRTIGSMAAYIRQAIGEAPAPV